MQRPKKLFLQKNGTLSLNHHNEGGTFFEYFFHVNVIFKLIFFDFKIASLPVFAPYY
jgi:hypothetical protein